jgi:hypothetical protein
MSDSEDGKIEVAKMPIPAIVTPVAVVTKIEKSRKKPSNNNSRGSSSETFGKCIIIIIHLL